MKLDCHFACLYSCLCMRALYCYCSTRAPTPVHLKRMCSCLCSLTSCNCPPEGGIPSHQNPVNPALTPIGQFCSKKVEANWKHTITAAFHSISLRFPPLHALRVLSMLTACDLLHCLLVCCIRLIPNYDVIGIKKKLTFTCIW